MPDAKIAKIAKRLERSQGFAPVLRAKQCRKVFPDLGLRIRPGAPKPQVEHRSGFNGSKLGDISDRRTTVMRSSGSHFASNGLAARAVRREQG